MLCVSAALLNLLYLVPENMRIMFQKHVLEKGIRAGGQQPGDIEEDKLAELNKSPQYRRLSQRFMYAHSVSSLVNMLSLLCSLVHVWYLTSHLQTI